MENWLQVAHNLSGSSSSKTSACTWVIILCRKPDLFTFRSGWPGLLGGWSKRASGFILIMALFSTVTASSHTGARDNDCTASSLLVVEATNSLPIYALFETWHPLPASSWCSLSVYLIDECMNEQPPGLEKWCEWGTDSSQVGGNKQGVVSRLESNSMGKLKWMFQFLGRKH